MHEYVQTNDIIMFCKGDVYDGNDEEVYVRCLCGRGEGDVEETK